MRLTDASGLHETAVKNPREIDALDVYNSAKTVKPVSGVYFLLDGEEIVYVGQSKTILKRLHTHLKSDKEFDRATYVEIPKNKLDEYESYFIYKFEPRYNRTKPQEYSKVYERVNTKTSVEDEIKEQLEHYPKYKWLKPKEAAEFLAVTPDELEKWRFEGKGPVFAKLSSQRVRYSPYYLKRWQLLHDDRELDIK